MPGRQLLIPHWLYERIEALADADGTSVVEVLDRAINAALEACPLPAKYALILRETESDEEHAL